MTGRGGRNTTGYSRRREFTRSGWATAVLTALALLVFGLLWRAHQRAQFHQLTAPIIPQTTSAPMPGGQNAILLSRVALVNDSEPEFVSATVLPGIGMQLLQTTVAVPNQPTQDLLASTSVGNAARMSPLSVLSAPLHLRVSPHHLQERGADDDLIRADPATDAQNQTLVDGGKATGTFQARGANAGVSATVEITLSGSQIDVVARATNTTQSERFASLEWEPRFAAPGGNLERFALLVPSRAAPSGVPAQVFDGRPVDFAKQGGQIIGDRALDVRFGKLIPDFLGDGASVQLQNGSDYMLRFLGMGETLRSLHVKSDPVAHTLLLGFSSMDQQNPDRREQMLRPGQTMQWHIRMEILPVKTSQQQH